MNTTITETVQTPAIDALLRKAHSLVATELQEGYAWSAEDAQRWHLKRSRVDIVERELYVRCENVLNAAESLTIAKQTAATEPNVSGDKSATDFLRVLEEVVDQDVVAENDAEHLALFFAVAHRLSIAYAGDEGFLGEYEYQR